jgi:hypothetical protein
MLVSGYSSLTSTPSPLFLKSLNDFLRSRNSASDGNSRLDVGNSVFIFTTLAAARTCWR